MLFRKQHITRAAALKLAARERFVMYSRRRQPSTADSVEQQRQRRGLGFNLKTAARLLGNMKPPPAVAFNSCVLRQPLTFRR
jgi:hypothetical protein